MHLGILTPDTQERCCVTEEELYLRRLLGAFRRMQDQAQFFLFTSEAKQNEYEGWMRAPVDIRAGAHSGLTGLLGMGRTLSRAVSKAGVDALLCPLGSAPASPPVPQWLYILDTRPWEADGELAGTIKQAKRICADARAIIVPSEYTRRRCLKVFDVPLDKVVVAPPGVDAVFAMPNECIVERPYIVIVGNTCKTHNYPRVFKALAQIQKETPHTLVIIGQACQAEPPSWGPRGMRVERCPDAQLAGLYQNAEAVVFATLHDGCGQRVLEVLRSGGIIVAPNIGAIPEFAGDTPIFYNYESVESIVRGIRRAFQEGVSTKEARLRASKRAAEFTWEKCAWKALSAFKRA